MPARARKDKGPCTLNGCSKPAVARGWCGMHLSRFYKHGDPHVKKIHRLPNRCTVIGCTNEPRRRLNGAPVCRTHEQRFIKRGAFNLPVRTPAIQTVCSVDGCAKPARTRKGRLCEMHYGRWYRTGDFNGREYKRRYINSSGYVVLSGRDHPLARTNRVFEHRAVLYDHLGAGVHPCHWCGAEVSWSAKGNRRLVVDHLDDNKHNNRLSNLVPACNPCNATRGLFMHWVRKHADDPFLERLFREAKYF